MTYDEAAQEAIGLEQLMNAEVESIGFHKPTDLLTHLRATLQQNEQQTAINNPVGDLKISPNRQVIEMGPQIDSGPDGAGYFRFDSGARLSFGITLTDSGKNCGLLSYRFHFVFPAGHNPEFIRFDLRSSGIADPLQESRAHIHPGLQDVRVPSRCMNPATILGYIVYVISQCPCPVCAGTL